MGGGVCESVSYRCQPLSMSRRNGGNSTVLPPLLVPSRPDGRVASFGDEGLYLETHASGLLTKNQKCQADETAVILVVAGKYAARRAFGLED